MWDRSRVERAVAGLFLAAVAGVGLFFGTAHATRALRALQTPAMVASARLDAAYYDCLDAQAHSVLRPGVPVTGVGDGAPNLITLEKAIGPWADLVPGSTPGAEHIDLRTVRGSGGCLGQVVTVTVHGPRGRVLVLTGHGATVPGHESPPAPIL